MKNFIFGHTVIVNWRVQTPEGEPVDLGEYTSKLYYITSRGRSEAQSVVISEDGDVLSWTFSGEEQAFKGEYGLRLEINHLNGAHYCTIDYPDLFRLSARSSGGDAQINRILNQQNGSQVVSIVSTVQSCGGSIVWGEIGGDIENQADLKAVKDKTEQNEDDITAIKAIIPSSASGANKLATKAELWSENKLAVIHYYTGEEKILEDVDLGTLTHNEKHIVLCVDESYYYPLVWQDGDEYFYFQGINAEERDVLQTYSFLASGEFDNYTTDSFAWASNVVHNDGDEEIDGTKTFNNELVVGEKISYGGEDGFGWIVGWDNELGAPVTLEDWLNEHFVAKTQQ